MTNATHIQKTPVRALDPEVLQRKASDPDSSVWVGASAGTGKTKVLTDRVLRLLLPRAGKGPGTPPHKILCLTFTKAGAGEMVLRLSGILSAWAVKPQQALSEELQKLLGRAPTLEDSQAARKLFTHVMESTGGLKIMTIHAFCQSVLGRFPLEAGLNPQFQVLEDVQASRLLEQARTIILQRAGREKTSSLHEALERISGMIGEDQFFALLNNTIRERHQLEQRLKETFGPQGLYHALCERLGVVQGQTPEQYLQEFCHDTLYTNEALSVCAVVLCGAKTKTDPKRGAAIQAFLSAPLPERLALYDEYKKVFLTNENKVRESLATKESQKTHPEISDILAQEALRILTVEEKSKAARIAVLTRDLFVVCATILEEYRTLKTGSGVLDFDDLIFYTLYLLQGEYIAQDKHVSAGWVQYKLDQGIDHILVDEAQDTNPEQWRIVEALCADFFAGQSARDIERTIFVVGDEKQSIYSFQRASPQEFQRMRQDFAQKIQSAQKDWAVVPMNISFRSTRVVLEAVDAVFSNPLARKGLSEDLEIQHQSFRKGQAGLVELWPVFETDETQEPDLWNPRPDPENIRSGLQKLSVHIAKTIKNWIANGEWLESHNRPVCAGDIMILVRTRSQIVHHMTRALKKEGLPVSGLDRVVLNHEIVIEDLFALAEFLLQPRDDLSLACALKSPLIGLPEAALYDLAIDRGSQSLWERMKAQGPQEIAQYLEALVPQARRLGPFAFFSHVLQFPCPADTVSGWRAFAGRLGPDVFELLDAFLNSAMQYETQEIPALQSFLKAQRQNESEMKREQDKNPDEIRIMTVHGSKGLQAPIVILPDTMTTPASGPARAEKRLLWPSQTGERWPLWSPRKEMDCDAVRTALSVTNERLEEEYRRLLYVAMTRAEDRLYIAGALGKRKMPEICWYRFVRDGLEALAQRERQPDGSVRLSCFQTQDPDKAMEVPDRHERASPFPPWLFQRVEDAEEVLAFVRPSLKEEPALSPLEGLGHNRFERGNLTHKLLEMLPAFPRDQWDAVSQRHLEQYGKNIPSVIQQEIQKEVLEILKHPAFSEFFRAEALAEVPISGFIEGIGVVHGQIDRLLVTPTDIYLVDFKTNRPPPTDPNHIPLVYREQMRLYRLVLQKIYPDRVIHTALLWTDGPFLMRIPQEDP